MTSTLERGTRIRLFIGRRPGSTQHLTFERSMSHHRHLDTTLRLPRSGQGRRGVGLWETLPLRLRSLLRSTGLLGRVVQPATVGDRGRQYGSDLRLRPRPEVCGRHPAGLVGRVDGRFCLDPCRRRVYTSLKEGRRKPVRSLDPKVPFRSTD